MKFLTVIVTPNAIGNPPGKLADAELHFTESPLEGLKLIGFAIWERRGGGGRNVTFPARQYSINGERRSYALLRPIADSWDQDKIRDLILEAYAEWETLQAVGEGTTKAQTYAREQAQGANQAHTPVDGCTCPMYPVVIGADCPIAAHHPEARTKATTPDYRSDAEARQAATPKPITFEF